MRHQSENVAGLVRDPRNAFDGAVHVLGVAERDLAHRLERSKQIGVAVPVALAVLDRDHELLADGPTTGERARRALDRDRDVGADELLLPVETEDAWQEACLAEDLEAVANPEYRPAVSRERGDRLHHRSKASDRTAAEVVAVGEPAGQDHALRPLRQCRLGVPDADGRGAEQLQREEGVPVVVRAGEGDNRDPRPFAHAPSPSSIENDSIIGLASSSWDIRSRAARASSGPSASSSTSTRRPTRAPETAKPRVRSASPTASPCGSRMPSLGRINTVAFTGPPSGRRDSARTGSRSAARTPRCSGLASL